MAIINKFGGEAQIPGNVISIVISAATDLTQFPFEVTTPYQLKSGQASYIIVENGLTGSIVLPTAGADTEGQSFTIRSRDADDVLVKSGATTLVTLTNAGEWVTVVCENTTAEVDLVQSWEWVIVASTPIVA